MREGGTRDKLRQRGKRRECAHAHDTEERMKRRERRREREKKLDRDTSVQVKLVAYICVCCFTSRKFCVSKKRAGKDKGMEGHHSRYWTISCEEVYGQPLLKIKITRVSINCWEFKEELRKERYVENSRSVVRKAELKFLFFSSVHAK